MNFTAQELDQIMRGLFALQRLQPTEAPIIQVLINKLAATIFEVSL
jgi:hypothetical protein